MNDNYMRIEKILFYIRKKPNTFAKALGFSNGTVFYQIKSGRNKISANLANKICNVYPEIDYTWLLTGKGNMLKVESESSTLIAKLQEQIVFLKNHVQGQDARIELLEQKLKEVNKNFNSIC